MMITQCRVLEKTSRRFTGNKAQDNTFPKIEKMRVKGTERGGERKDMAKEVGEERDRTMSSFFVMPE